jgi:type II secretory pathway component PulF
MPTFAYKAKTGPGQTVEGELQAQSRAAALLAVDEMGYSPLWVRQKSAASEKQRGRRGRIRRRDITVFTRQLGSLTRSGVPILRSLATIARQTESLRLRATIEELENTIRDGSMLSDALARFPALFPDLYVNMIRAGESGGILDTSLFRLADAREKEEETRRKVQAAMAYPLLIVSVGVATVFVLLTFFLPRVIELFRDYRALPLPTRMLISTSDFFSDYWYWIVLAVVLVVAVFRRLVALDTGRTFVDALLLRLPLVGKFTRQSDIARFARTLALLVDCGIPIDRGLALSADTLRNAVLRAEIEDVHRNTVQRGLSLSAGLKKTAHFPDFVSNMTAVGEEAGNLDESLVEIAVFYEKEVDQQSRLMTSLLEPILILLVGVVVGFIVTAMLLPIFEMGTSIR